MLSSLQSLFDFHPKEQKGILTLVVLLVITTVGHIIYDRTFVRPSLLATVPPQTLDSLHAAYHLSQPTGPSFDEPFESNSFSKERQNSTYESQAPFPTDRHAFTAFPNNAAPKWPTKSSPAELDINAADSVMWLSVRGIGPYTAKKIMAYKHKLGGFHTVEQLKEIYKIDPLVFDTSGTTFICAPGFLQKININTCTQEQLAQHPYLNKSQAKSIIAYREMHGSYPSLQTLEKVVLLDASTRVRITPYLTVE